MSDEQEQQPLPPEQHGDDISSQGNANEQSAQDQPMEAPMTSEEQTPPTKKKPQTDKTQAQPKRSTGKLNTPTGKEKKTEEPTPKTPTEPLPVPVLSATNPQALADLKRLRHRRKRYTLYVLRTHRRRDQQRSKSRARAVWMTFAIIFGIIVALSATVVQSAVSFYDQQRSVLDSIQNSVIDSDSVRIYDIHNTLLYQLNDFGVKHSICYAQMPTAVQEATVAIEDKDYWHNSGVDYQRILSAALTNYQSGKTQQGASTITQQLIKNTVTGSQTTLDRKIKEAILAFGITETGQYSKTQIMAMYLNTISYGPTIIGLDAAAHAYFGYNDDQNVSRDCSQTPYIGHVAAEKLTLGQASFLAGIPENPNLNNPLTPAGFQNALSRQRKVLDDMVAQKYINQADADAAWKESHSISFLNLAPQIENLAPHFVEYVKDELSQMIDSGQISLSRTGLSVYTTLDLSLQNRVQDEMKKHLFGQEVDEYGTLLKNDNVSNSAAILIQQNTGDIRVLLGSYDYNATQAPNGKVIDGKFNVATQGYRQPGSTMKPLLYTMAFEKGWFPAQTINDAPTIFPDIGTGGVYKPLDAERGKFENVLTIREALQHSLDIPAVKALQFVGLDYYKQGLTRFGITDYQGSVGLASSLGALDIHPIDMVHAFSVLANYGRSVPLNAIDHINDAQGNTIYNYVAPKGTQVVDPRVAFLTTSIITDDKTREADFGKCSPLRVYSGTYAQCYSGNPGFDLNIGAKTGTTDNLTNDWAMGYTTQYTGGVWVGNNNENDGMYHISGITGAAPIWNQMMLMAHGCANTASSPTSWRGGSGDATGCQAPAPFPVPQGVVRATYSSNGKTTQDWFLAENVPSTQGVGNGGATGLCIKINDSTGDWNYCTGPQVAGTATPKKGP